MKADKSTASSDSGMHSICIEYRDFASDALRVTRHGSDVIGCSFVDSCAANDSAIASEAHRDGIQLIPPEIFPRSNYAGAEINNIRIMGNRIAGGTGKLQGIFSSDGVIRDVRVIANVIDTSGDHFISLAGVLSGWFEGNVRPDGSPCPIFLPPLRLGGNSGEGNVYILSMSNPGYEYMPIDELVHPDGLAYVKDTRRTGTLGLLDAVDMSPARREALMKDRHLVNFDLLGYRKAARRISPSKIASLHAGKMQDLALEFGDLIQCQNNNYGA